jgi:dihydrodipicolinate reductase
LNKVIFGLENERLELTAHVYNMDTYAGGMIEAGLFLSGKDPGLYALTDVFRS